MVRCKSREIRSKIMSSIKSSGTGIEKSIAEKIKVSGGDIVGFYTDGERVWLERMNLICQL